jgi:ketosteroid isomerase-like protein
MYAFEMHAMKTTLLAFGLMCATMLASAAAPAAAQAPEPKPARITLDSAAKAELLDARERIWRAWFANDSAELARLLPPAAVAAEGENGWEDRAAIVTGSQRFAASGGKLVRIRFFDTEIVSYGNVAILHARFELETDNHGRRSTSSGRATELFVRRAGRWVNPFWHLES